MNEVHNWLTDMFIRWHCSNVTYLYELGIKYTISLICCFFHVHTRDFTHIVNCHKTCIVAYIYITWDCISEYIGITCVLKRNGDDWNCIHPWRDHGSDRNASGMLVTDLLLSFCIYRHIQLQFHIYMAINLYSVSYCQNNYCICK